MDKDKVKALKSLPLPVIGERYGFRFDKVGDKLRGLCLFHNDTGTPNLFLYPDDSFFCFACKRGGPKAAFVAYAERVDRRVVEQLWEADTPLGDLLDMRLKPQVADYRPQLQLYVAKLFQKLRAADPTTPISVLKDVDRILSSRRFIALNDYSETVDLLNKQFGGQNG